MDGERKPAQVGEVGAREAWDRLTQNAAAQLVDVRSRAEWSFVGIPELGGISRQTILVEWQTFPDMRQNDAFAATLKAELDKRGVDTSTPIYFICRSGARSMSAAHVMAAAGYAACFNVAGGFEGRADGERHRGKIEGWKAEGLPWVQS